MSKSRWRYWDHRAWTLDAHGLRTSFAQVSKAELRRAYQAKMSAGAYQLWLFLQHEISGRTAQRNPAGWILGSQQIQRETGMSRASVYRAIRQLRDAGLIGCSEEKSSMKCWLSIPLDESGLNHPLAENNSGKLEVESQNCDKGTEADPSQKGTTADPCFSAELVANLSQDPRSYNSPRLTRGGEAKPTPSRIAKRERGIEVPTELVSVLYSMICEDSDGHRDRISAWREHPDGEAYRLTSKSIAMRYGPPQSELQLAGWKGTHRVRTVKQAMQLAIEWTQGVYAGF